MLGPTGAAHTRAHLRYLRRDGVEPDGRPGVLYDRSEADLDPGRFIERAQGDSGQVRFVLSPDDASELPDLRDVVRAVMAGVGRDLQREVDWVAVDHANTGRLHAHVVLRGDDALARTLGANPRRLRQRVRERAMDALTRELGPDSDRILRERLRVESRSQQLTGLDLGLIERSRSGAVDLRDRPADRDAHLARARLIDRVRTLSRMGLAVEAAPLRWVLSPDLAPTLRAMGERRETHRLLERALVQNGIRRPHRDRALAGGRELSHGIIGALLAWGDRSGARPTPYAVVDGVDGRVWYADLAVLPAGLARGAVIELRSESPHLSGLDRQIEAEAGAPGGLWAAGRPGRAAADRRVRALTRAGLAEPAGPGHWRVAAGFRRRLRALGLDRQYRIACLRVLDSRSLDRQVRDPEWTWLDRLPEAGLSTLTAGRGFGGAVRRAFRARRRPDRGIRVRRPDPAGPDRGGTDGSLSRTAGAARNGWTETGRRDAPGPGPDRSR